MFAYTYDEKVHIQGRCIEVCAIFADFRRFHGSVRDVDILLLDVNQIYDFIVQTAVAALFCVRSCRIVLVNGENLDILERDFSFLIGIYQQVVQRVWRTSRSQAEFEKAFLSRLCDNGGPFFEFFVAVKKLLVRVDIAVP